MLYFSDGRKLNHFSECTVKFVRHLKGKTGSINRGVYISEDCQTDCLCLLYDGSSWLGVNATGHCVAARCFFISVSSLNCEGT